MKIRHIFLSILITLFIGWVYADSTIPELPPLKDGDLVFQTTVTKQSGAIIAASSSLYTHVGIIKMQGDHAVVIEAADEVREIELKPWLDSGLLNRVAVYREPELAPEQAQELLASAEKLLGRPYDILFSFHNNAIYCSELPYLAYKSAGIPIGTVQKVGDLNVNNPWVKRLINQRWRLQTECKERDYDFEQCYGFIMKQKLITPASIAGDPKLTKIYSNYPF